MVLSPVGYKGFTCSVLRGEFNSSFPFNFCCNLHASQRSSALKKKKKASSKESHKASRTIYCFVKNTIHSATQVPKGFTSLNIITGE